MDEQVYRRLKYLPNSNVFDHIAWQVNGNTVVLSGKVYTLGTKTDAASAVPKLIQILDQNSSESSTLWHCPRCGAAMIVMQRFTAAELSTCSYFDSS